jgi:endonuclease YncB( thermonuclease family)
VNKKLVSAIPLVIAVGLIAYAFMSRGKANEPTGDNSSSPPAALEGYPAQVVSGSIHDGDTIRVTSSAPELKKYADKKGQIKVRFACIDAPETGQKRGAAARSSLQRILADNGDRVNVQPVDVDRYGRVVAELWTNEGLVQSIQAGLGDVFPYEQYKQNCKNWEAVSASAADAKQARRGVWADAKPEYPWEWRRRK